MGFYGNVTNTSKTTFSFDRRYANRYLMDNSCATDGVFIGRYVLVEYDSETTLDGYNQAFFRNAEDKNFYASRSSGGYTDRLIAGTSGDSNVELNEIIVITPERGSESGKNEFWQCTGAEEGTNYALFTFVTNVDTSYTRNYNIDVNIYGEGRGYDSTVWTKTYTSDAKPKYVQIAELNTVIPTFDITADAPTATPIAPHFDSDSTNVYYKVHWQPQWGLRIRGASQQSGNLVNDNGEIESTGSTVYSTEEAFPSDESTTWVRTRYILNQVTTSDDAQGTTVENSKVRDNIQEYFDPETSTWIPFTDFSEITEDKVPAAIYYNRAGFDSALKTEYDEFKEIELTAATYQKGKYYLQNPSTKEYTLSDDIFNPNFIYYEAQRGKDVIAMTPTGLSGKLYNPHDGSLVKRAAEDTYELSIMLPTLGNTISDVWDLVYNDPGNGNLRNRDIEWDSIDGVRLVHEDENGNGYSYSTEQTETIAGCINSVHDLMGMIIEDDTWSLDNAELDRIYYFKDANGNNVYHIKYPTYKYTEIKALDSAERYNGPLTDLIDYTSNTYYYRSANDYYLSTESKPVEGNKYYTITNTPVELDTSYFTNSFFYQPATDPTSYYLDDSESPIDGRTYFEITPTTITTNEKLFYESSTYYYFDESDKSYKKDTNETLTEGRQYYNVTIIEKETDSFYENDEGILEPVITTTFTKEEVELFPFQADTYYYYSEDRKAYILGKTVNNELTYYTLEVEAKGGFYQGSKYYFIQNGNYILDKRSNMTDGRSYYNITPVLVNKTFYQADKYFYKVGEEYILDTNDTLTSDREYYVYEYIYVISDSQNIFNRGAIWNDNVTAVPSSVVLGTRELTYEWKELEGFARKLNTIHGLIIQINELLKAGDTLTRDQETVQGSINVLNDIIAKFDLLIPGQLLLIDEYGRLENTKWTTTQEYSTKNEQTSHTETNSNPESNWVLLETDPTVNNTLITITHTYHGVDDTTTKANKNSGTYTGTEKGNNDSTDDTLTLYTPIVDNMGHIVGKNTETVTLPYSFKYIKTNGVSSSVVDMSTSTTQIVADNTKDTLTINSGNKWTKIANNADSDTLTIAHEVHSFDRGQANTNYGLESDKDYVNNASVPTSFKVPYVSFDEAGHMTAVSDNTVTLPYIFNKVEVTTNTTENTDSLNGSAATGENLILADNYNDTLSFKEGNKWINLFANVNSDSITISHYVKNFEETESSVNYNSGNNQFAIQEIAWDRAGHITSSNKKTYTMPNDYQILKIVNSGNESYNFGEAASGSLIAENPIDTATIDTGNRWITLIADVNNKTFTIYHAAAGTAASTKGESANKSPAFGESFKVLQTGIDAAGHVSELSERAITLPKNSLINGTGQVVTGLALEDSTGKFTETKANLGTLSLTGYSKGTSGGTISAEDSLNVAIGKLEYKIDQEIKDRTDLDVEDTEDTTKFISSITQTDGKIDFKRADADSLVVDGETLATIKEKAFEEQTQADWEETDTTSKAFIKNKPDLSNIVETNTEFAYGEEKYTIEGMFEYIKKLEDRILALEGSNSEVEDSGN